MRLFRPLTSFLPSRPFAPSLGFSLLSSIPVVVAFRLCPSRFFIDSNLFHFPPVRSSQHHPGLVPISLGDIRPCCLHLPSFCRLVSQRSRTSLRLRLPVSVRPVHPCQPRAVRTRGVFTHRDDFGKPACVERGLVRTAMFHASADVPRMGAPVMERAGSSGNAGNGSYLAGADAAEGHAGQVASSGSSGNAENGSHLARADAAEGHAGQVGGPGSSGNAENGSHLAATDAAEGHAGQVDGPGSSGNAVNGYTWQRRTSAMSPGWSCGGTPHRAVQNQAFCRTGRPRRTVRYRKRPCGVREVHLSAGAARGGGSSAGRHVERMTGVSGNRWRIVVAQVRRKSMMARWLQSRTTQSLIRAVADKRLIMSRIMICPVWFC